MSTALPDIEIASEVLTRSDSPWVTVVWNDPVNLMNYVSYVFRSYFGYNQQRADALMLQVHNNGRAIVSHGVREKMEVDAQAMQSFGLWATIEKSGQE